MISKRIPMKSAKKSSFVGLVKYITSSQGIEERVGEVRITNCQSEDVNWAVIEALNTQKQNTRAEGDRTYHLLISFAPGEKPSAEVLRDVEDRLCAAMGYGDHQRISAVHADTDALHIHVAINKIHPTKLTMHEPYRDFRTRADVCAQLEKEHGLEKGNHVARKSVGESKAIDMERHAGIESLVSWVRQECLASLKEAQSWGEFNQVLAAHGLEAKAQGNGLVLASHSGVQVKASTVARELSKSRLEERLGGFPGQSKMRAGLPKKGPGDIPRQGVRKVGARPPKGIRPAGLGTLATLQIDSGKRYEKRPIEHRVSRSELYSRYQAEQQAVAQLRQKALLSARRIKDRELETARQSSRLKRSAIKLISANPLAKKALYASTHATLTEELAKIRAKHTAQVESINQTHKRRQWADWLQAKAKEGNADALAALRAREHRGGLKGDVIHGQGAPSAQSVQPAQKHVTKEGTVIFSMGASAIRDDGDKLQISRGASYDSIEAALRMAAARYGDTVTIGGSDSFKEQVARTAALRNLPIKFDDAALEQRRLHLQQAIERAKENDRTDGRRPDQHGVDRRGDSIGTGRTGSGQQRGASTARTANRTGVPGRAGAGLRASGRSVSGRPGVGGRPVSIRPAGVSSKPGIGPIGRNPPAAAKDRLRRLSQLGVVQLADRGEMLLPRDVPGVVVNQGAERTDGLRRDVSRRGMTEAVGAARQGARAAQTYIAEREGKRAEGFDIPKHRLYTSGDDGVATYAGVRRIEGQHLALLRRGEEVIVLPVNEATARRIQRKKVGDQVTLGAGGAITTRGRSR